MFSRFFRLNANGDFEIKLGCRSTVFVYRLYADEDSDHHVLVGLRSKTSLDDSCGSPGDLRDCGRYVGFPEKWPPSGRPRHQFYGNAILRRLRRFLYART
jgi:hypothetical protein